MPEALASIASAALLLVAFALLALSQERHRETLRDALPAPSQLQTVLPAARRRRQRGVAAASIVLAWLPCAVWHGAGLGTLLWAFLCFAGAFSVALLLTWHPRMLAPLAR